MSIINRTMYPVQKSMKLISGMQERFSQLQVQLATGQKAATLAEMGSDRYFDLSLRSRINRIEGYRNSVDLVNLRLEVYDQVLGRLDKVESNARAAIVTSNYGSSNINFGTAPVEARNKLDEVVSLLNSEVEGRYLFAGGKIDQRPVEAASAMLYGAGGKAGFKQIADERLMADQGAGLGRLELTVSANSVELEEDGAHVFGLKLSTLTTTSSGITLTGPSGAAPRSLTIEVDALPLPDQIVTMGLTLPDGTEEQVVLRAVTGTPGPGEFQIGATVDDTAASLGAALNTSLTRMAKTEMVIASNYAAAENFFNGQNEPILRVVGPGFATATTLTDMGATPPTTIQWYKGEDATDARATVKAKIDDAASVSYGAQANESGPLALIRSLAVLAIQSFTNTDEISEGRFDAVAGRNFSRLSESHNNTPGSIEMMGVQLGNAHVTVAGVSERHTTYKSQLEGLLEGIESVSKEEVAMEMLALQTRLQASYQATSLVASLSLVNYLK